MSYPNLVEMLALLLLLSTASSQPIVEYSSNITLKNTTNGNVTTVSLLSLSGYQDTLNYERNMTLTSTRRVSDSTDEGQVVVRMCFINDTKGQNYAAFLTQCRQNASAPADSYWVLVTDAEDDKDDNLEVLKQANAS